MQNVLKHAKFLLSLVFLTEALHGQSKSSQNPKQTLPGLVHPSETRNSNTDKRNNPHNNEHNFERGEDHYFQSNSPPLLFYKQYKSNQDENSDRNPLNIYEEKMSANNREEQEQRFQQPRKPHQQIRSFNPGNGENNPHQTQNPKSSQFQDHSSVIPQRANHMNRRDHLSLHGPVQKGKVQRPIRLFPDPYKSPLDKHLQEKEDKPLYEDYRKVPANSRKAAIHQEASEESSHWHESEAITPPSRRNNLPQEISAYPSRNQFQNRELLSPQQNHSGSGFSTDPGRPSNSDSQTNYRQNYRPSEGTLRLGPNLDHLDNEGLHDSVTRKHSNAGLAQPGNLNFNRNFPPRTVLRPSQLRNDNLRNSFSEHSNTESSMQDNSHLRQNYPSAEGTSRSVTQSDKLQQEYLPDSFKQHSNRDSLYQNNFNPQVSGRNWSPYTQDSPDFDQRSTNKDFQDQRQQNFQSPLPPPLEKPHLKENSKYHASNANNLSPSQRLPHLDEDLPPNQNIYRNEKTPFSHRSVKNSKHNFENPLPHDNYPNYPEKQHQSEGPYSDFSDEYSLPLHQNNQNSGSSFKPLSRNGQGRNKQELLHRELHTDYSDRLSKSHQELPKPRELHTDYSISQNINHQEFPPTRELHTDYSNGQGRDHQELPQNQELHTDYSNRQGQNHHTLPELQERQIGYSDENAPNFHHTTDTNENSQAHLLRENLRLNYRESPTLSQGLQQKYPDENSSTNNKASQTSKIPYVRSFTEGRYLGHQETFQYLPENSEFGDDSLNKKNNPSASQSKILSSNKKGRQVAIGDYSVENHDAQPVEYHSPQQYHDHPSRIKSNKRQGRLESLPVVDNPLKEQTAGESYSEPDSRLPAAVEHNNLHKHRSSRQRTAQRSLSPDQNSQNGPVKRSGEDDSTVKNLTFSATVERDHILSMGSEQEPDSAPEPEERDDDDDDFGEEQHDGFLDMGAYTDKQGSFGWYADFPVGRGHDKMSYSSS